MGLWFLEGRPIWPCLTPGFRRCFSRTPSHPSASGNSSRRIFAIETRGGPTTRLRAWSFSDWCKGSGLFDLARVKPIQVAAYVEELQLRRRAKTAGIQTKIGNHTFRATGITAYLKNGGKLEIAQQIAAHESSRTTGLYDRRDDDVNLDEVERISI